jgi:alpha-L-fucosidase
MKNKMMIILIALTGVACSMHDVQPPEVCGPAPTERQLAWHQMEMNAFIHFTTNTFTDKEWGYGDEKPEVFNPGSLNTEKWVETLKKAGFKGIILTCKHHDGFCLWPSQYTEHSVKNSKWKNGQGNVVQEVHDACRKSGLKFGIYVSPWDRNRADYGTPSYVEYYRNQLKELFNLYNPVFEMWFDGANGGDGYYGGAREKRKIDGKTYYDWPGTLKIIREMAPDVIFFSDAGPDIRWCGNESGFIGETNWNTLNSDTIFAGKPNITDLLNKGEENGKFWIPAEVDVSIRPGWFYHAREDSLVKTPQQLFDIYLNSVGRGSNLLLNVPPDRRGLLHENDVKSLMEWRKLLDETFKVNLALQAKVKADSYRGNSKRYAGQSLTDADPETYWATDDDKRSGSLVIELGSQKPVRYVILQEYIKLGQRVKSFTLDVWDGNTWKQAAAATTIGYKRIVKIDPVETAKIRINISDAKACPVISNVEVY